MTQIPNAAELPPSSKPIGGVLTSARALPSGWERGIVFTSGQCLSPQPWPYCPDPEQEDKQAQRPSDPSTFNAYGVVQPVECSAFGLNNTEELANQSLDVTRELIVGEELANSSITTNPSLANGTDIDSPNSHDVVTALALLENHAAQGISGRMVFYHISPGNLTLLLSARAIWRDGRVWRTGMGNVVIASPGYHSLIDLHATGEVFAGSGSRSVHGDVERTVNTITSYAEEVALAAFDPCYNAFVTLNPINGG